MAVSEAGLNGHRNGDDDGPQRDRPAPPDPEPQPLEAVVEDRLGEAGCRGGVVPWLSLANEGMGLAGRHVRSNSPPEFAGFRSSEGVGGEDSGGRSSEREGDGEGGRVRGGARGEGGGGGSGGGGGGGEGGGGGGGGGDGDGDGGGDGDGDGEEGAVELVPDLLHTVFAFLRQRELCQLARVCKLWKAVSEAPEFWKRLDFGDRPVGVEVVVRLCSKYILAQEVRFRASPAVGEAVVRDGLGRLGGLHTLVVGRGWVEEGFFWALETHCPGLKVLRMNSAVLNGHELVHAGLTELQLARCRMQRVVVRCPLLETLSLEESTTASATLHCPMLRTLNLSHCQKLFDAGVRTAASTCPTITSLDVSHCVYVSDATLREVASTCVNLTHLDASGCPNVALDGVRFPALSDLKLKYCEKVGEEGISSLLHSPNLQRLVLDECSITRVALDLSLLSFLSLQRCQHLVEIHLRTPHLASLNLTGCMALTRVDVLSTQVESLALREQRKLETLLLNCPRLAFVDLSDCDSLPDSAVTGMGDEGACPALTTLLMDNCESLTNVALRSRQVTTLSLAGCGDMTSLCLDCPALQTLQLDNCDRLATAALTVVALQGLNLGICPHLKYLTLSAPSMTSLDLRGCGVLEEALLHCPRLDSLDASYCSQLRDEALHQMAHNCPAVSTLVVAACFQITAVGLRTLSTLSLLTRLDLSYTFLTDLRSVYEACGNLEALQLSACKYLEDGALRPLYAETKLPRLRHLDLSYTCLSQTAIGDVIARCRNLRTLSVNGCQHIDDRIWESVTGAEFLPPESRDVPPLAGTEEDDMAWSCADVAPGDVDEGQVAVGHVTLVTAGGGKILLGRILKPASHFCGIGEGGGDAVPGGVPGQQLPRQLPTWAQGQVPGGEGQRRLESLSFVGCGELTRVLIPLSSASVRLTVLNLALAKGVRTIQLACPNLATLNLSNCVSLEALTLHCPKLSSLLLSGCDLDPQVIEREAKHLPLLETLDLRNCDKVTAEVLRRLRLSSSSVKRVYNSLAG